MYNEHGFNNRNFARFHSSYAVTSIIHVFVTYIALALCTLSVGGEACTRVTLF